MESIVAISIWLSVFCWAISIGFRISGAGRNRVRAFWTAGILVYGIHVVSAFEAHYHWSHRFAFEETARETEQMTGRKSGFGLWLNYLFGIVWLADAVVWWVRGHAVYFGRSRWVNRFLHGFLVFMIFNGTVIFVSGPGRWLGIAIFAGLVAVWLGYRRIESGARNS